MSSALQELKKTVVACLDRCSATTGHGTFNVRSERTDSASVRYVVEGTPSYTYHAGDDLILAQAVAADGTYDRGQSARSMIAVAGIILDLLCQVYHRSNANGGVEVRCRRQPNGKTRVQIKNYFINEIVLRPDEIEVIAEAAV